jgi:hypothetical protein
MNMQNSLRIKTWAQFDRQIRSLDRKLLARLSDFEAPVLVAGCQRSGTTILTRILQEALGMAPLQFTGDDELDAALILSGEIGAPPDARCCFQTTYVNDHLAEYFEHSNYKLIWLIRRPEAVVRSMLLNWRRAALRRLFRACGRHALDEKGARRFDRFGTFGFRRLQMACLSYNVKTAQIHALADKLTADRLHILDYDDLIGEPEVLLPRVFEFAGIPFDDRFLSRLAGPNRPKGRQLTELDKKTVVGLCDAEYQRAAELARSWNK